MSLFGSWDFLKISKVVEEMPNEYDSLYSTRFLYNLQFSQTQSGQILFYSVHSEQDVFLLLPGERGPPQLRARPRPPRPLRTLQRHLCAGTKFNSNISA